MTARVAVDRAIRVVNIPSGSLFLAILVIGFVLLRYSVVLAAVLGGILLLAALVATLSWWAYVVPRWRAWAVDRGADPVQLQKMGEDLMFLWPAGSLPDKITFLFLARKR